MDENVYGNLNKDLDENLPWLTQKTEDLKNNNKGNPTLTPPPFQVHPPFLGKIFVPPEVTQFLEGPTPLRGGEGGGGGGGSNYA